MDQEKLTLDQLAKKHGHWVNQLYPEDGNFDGPHNVADVRHGWSAHKWFTGSEVMLTSEDYLAAIEHAQENMVHEGADHTAARDAAKQRRRNAAKVA